MTPEENSTSVETEGHIHDGDDLLGIDYKNLQQAIKIFRALNNKLRQRIMEKIYEKKKIHVNDLVDCLRIDQSAVSQQLAILRDAGIVSTIRDGRYVFYAIDVDKLAKINTHMKHFLRR